MSRPQLYRIIGPKTLHTYTEDPTPHKHLSEMHASECSAMELLLPKKQSQTKWSHLSQNLQSQTRNRCERSHCDCRGFGCYPNTLVAAHWKQRPPSTWQIDIIDWSIASDEILQKQLDFTPFKPRHSPSLLMHASRLLWAGMEQMCLACQVAGGGTNWTMVAGKCSE